MATTVAQLFVLLLALSLLLVAVVITRVATYIVVSTADVRYWGCCNMHQYPFNFNVFGVGMPSFAVQMNAFYKYIGEGHQPAYDWINGRF